MSETATHAFDWRQRSGTFVVATLLVAAICVGLYLASRHFAAEDANHSEGVEVLLQPKPLPPHHVQPRPRTASAAPPTPTLLEPPLDHVTSQMLICFGPHRNEHPECAQAQTPSPLARDSLSVGHGSFDGPPPIDYSAGLTRGEQLAGMQHHKPCETNISGVGACARLPPPPPPSRTAEEICQQQNMGGPCHPPIPDEPQHVRRTPSTPP